MASSNTPRHFSWRQGAPLWRIESEMVAAAQAGEQAGSARGPFDLEAMNKWRSGRTIRAAVLQHLLVGDEWPVHARGVRLRGVRIIGQLDLEAATLRCPLRLERCYFSAPVPVNLNYASGSLIILTGCRMAGINGDLLRVSKELDVSGSTFTKQVRLPGADITGQFSCRGARLKVANKDDSALFADRMKVGGSVLLDEVTAAGAVRLPGAHIAGQLRCKDARLNESLIYGIYIRHRPLGLRLVPGLAGPGRVDEAAVAGGELTMGAVDLRIIPGRAAPVLRLSGTSRAGTPPKNSIAAT
jgi:hypothetical protein